MDNYWTRNLIEYSKKPRKLMDLMPWLTLIALGVILNKFGALQKTYKFRGPDMQSYSVEAMRSLAEQFNQLLMKLTGGWVLYFDTHRTLSPKYPVPKWEDWPDPISYLIELERALIFNKGEFFQNNSYITFCFMPPPVTISMIEKIFIEKGAEKLSKRHEDLIRQFENQVYEISDVFSKIVPEFYPLDDDETLTYLYSTINTNPHPIKTPENPIWLDYLLTNSTLLGGFEPKLNDEYFQVITIKSYPERGEVGILNELNEFTDFEYRWINRFIFQDKEEAVSEIKKHERIWAAGKQSFGELLRKILFPNMQSNAKENAEASHKETEAEIARYEQQMGITTYGFHTQTIILRDKNRRTLEYKTREVKRILNGLSMSYYVETLNNVQAWFGSVPCIPQANVRRPLLSTKNLAALVPLSNAWTGPETVKHLEDAPPLLQALTSGRTPFRFSNYVKDVAHTMIAGPTGTGKSALIGLMGSQFRRYKKSRVVWFDNGGSCKCITYGVGGKYYEISSDKPNSLSFQPLAKIDDMNERRWAQEWILSILKRENAPITTDTNTDIWEALNKTAISPKEQRTMTEFHAHMSSQNRELGNVIKKYTMDGPYGNVLDADKDQITDERWVAFEMEHLMELPTLIPTVLAYIFHVLETIFEKNPVPTAMFLDEAWVWLNDSYFQERIMKWLQIMRKYKTGVIFATPGMADILNSDIASTLIGQCKTRIFLPNPNAFEENQRTLYSAFDLSETQIGIISKAIPTQHYYIVQPDGQRLMNLDLPPFALAYCGATSKEEQKIIDRIYEEANGDTMEFNKRWLIHKKMGDVVEMYTEYFSKENPETPMQEVAQ